MRLRVDQNVGKSRARSRTQGVVHLPLNVRERVYAGVVGSHSRG